MYNNNLYIESRHSIEGVQETQQKKIITLEKNMEHLENFIERNIKYKCKNFIIVEIPHEFEVIKTKLIEQKAKNNVLYYWDEKAIAYTAFQFMIDDYVWKLGMGYEEYDKKFKSLNTTIKILKNNNIFMVVPNEYFIYLDNTLDIYTNNKILKEKLERIDRYTKKLEINKPIAILINSKVVGTRNEDYLKELCWTKTINSYGFKVHYI